MKQIEICFSPVLFEYRTLQNDYIAVVVDIFRATTCFCTALFHGATAIIPVVDLSVLEAMKNQGYITAAERGGKKISFADFGNDPKAYITKTIVGKEIAYSTTNGTIAIEKVIQSGCENIVIASFLNISAIANYLIQQNQNILILCSGWEKQFSFEDTFFSGALSEKLLDSSKFETNDDATKSAVALWKSGKSSPMEAIEKNSSHLRRLLSFGITNTLPYALQEDICPLVPTLKNGKFIA